MDRFIEVAVIFVGGLVPATLTTWWSDRATRREARALHERAQEQERELAVVSAELQLTRSEISRLQSELTCVRFAVECLAEGPPSRRAPSQQAS